MTKYKHIFFDLDRTLWDFEKNSEEVFRDMYRVLKIEQKGIKDFDEFFASYRSVNHDLWDLYRMGKIDKEFLNYQRFYQTLYEFGIEDDELAKDMGKKYVEWSPLKKHLFPGTMELLEYLKPNYHLHIITNGFEEVQTVKLQESNLAQYFEQVIISETTPVKKPHPKIFKYAMHIAGAEVSNSLMIGDDVAIDIKGAAGVGMDQVWVNFIDEAPSFKPTYEVKSLLDIKTIL
ncbi:MAG: YjjG family noncanonical pyrimidine nucleotidase [Bacteroidales bacterium]|nr:YjjG family noncanonical pyrimidine nucleotidase [Bacteroidales bacterium]